MKEKEYSQETGLDRKIPRPDAKVLCKVGGRV